MAVLIQQVTVPRGRFASRAVSAREPPSFWGFGKSYSSSSGLTQLSCSRLLGAGVSAGGGESGPSAHLLGR